MARKNGKEKVGERKRKKTKDDDDVDVSGILPKVEGLGREEEENIEE